VQIFFKATKIIMIIYKKLHATSLIKKNKKIISSYLFFRNISTIMRYFNTGMTAEKI